MNRISEKRMNEETKQFINEHEQDDVHNVSLQSGHYKNIDIDLAIRQIVGKQKIRSKVPRFYNAKDILYPKQLSLEQSSSETTALYKAALCQGNTLVDLTGGFGVDCCFMAEHFKQVVYVERQEELCELAKHNFKVLGENHIEVIHTETVNYLREMNQVDWVFIDPARRSTAGKKVVFLSDCEPDVTTIISQILEKTENVMIKLSPMMDITAAVRELPQTKGVHIVAVENECKEILLILGHTTEKTLDVHTINFGKNNKSQAFDFNQDEEANISVSYTSIVGKYLYEPNAAVMKSGAFKLIGNRFGLSKLHINTHLYSSDELIVDFPGRIFEVQSVWENSKKELKNNLQRLSKANLTTRNYPISVEDLRKKLKIKDGGDSYLFACTLADEKKVIIECRKVLK